MFKHPLLRDFLTGVFALGAVAGLAAVLILFGEMSDLGTRYYRFTVVLPSAGGLGPTSPVTVNGVRVGQVLETDVVPEGAALLIKVREDVKIPTTSPVTVEKGLIGDSALEFTVRDATNVAAEAFVRDGGRMASTATGGFFDRIAGSFQKPLDRLTASADKFDRLADTWTQTGELVNAMLRPRTPGEVDAGATPNIASVVARLDGVGAAAQSWLADDQIRAGVRDTVTRAGVVLADLQTFLEAWTATADSVDITAQKVGIVAENVDRQAAGLAQDASNTLRRVDAAAAELQTALGAINAGEGTAGQLARNPDLYNSLNSAARRLDGVLTELNLLVQQMKAEGVKLKL
ncbi:MAG: MlaD family protein [Planctomycetota bacterium]|nr:MlaD family protein [Planctomycetota bacterium]